MFIMRSDAANKRGSQQLAHKIFYFRCHDAAAAAAVAATAVFAVAE